MCSKSDKLRSFVILFSNCQFAPLPSSRLPEDQFPASTSNEMPSNFKEVDNEKRTKVEGTWKRPVAKPSKKESEPVRRSHRKSLLS